MKSGCATWLRALIFSALLLWLSVSTEAAVFPSWASLLVTPSLPHDARWGLVVIDLATGRELLRAGNSHDRPLVPGSLMKLITTGALLDHMERHGRPDMRTTLSHDGTIRGAELQGNLYLTGRGNAMLTADDLHTMATGLSRRGIGKIAGDIFVDTSLIDGGGLERKREGAAYAPASALGLDLHTVAVTVSATRIGEPPAVKVEPPNDAVRLAVAARTVGTDASTLQLNQLDDLSYSVTGNIPLGAAPVRKRFLLREPAKYAGGALRTVLKEKGIAVTGEVRKGRTPSNSTRLAEIPSPDPDRLLCDMNVNSLNVVADNLLLILGAEKFGASGTREKGERAEREFLGELGLSMYWMRIADGSGLGGENRVTAEFMTTYLLKAAQKPWFPKFVETLPRAGMDGTARNIGFTNERFRVKTGVLPDVYGLAGYGMNGSGREIAFAFLVNHPGISGFDMKRAGAEVMKILVNEVSQ